MIRDSILENYLAAKLQLEKDFEAVTDRSLLKLIKVSFGPRLKFIDGEINIEVNTRILRATVDIYSMQAAIDQLCLKEKD